MKKELAMGGIVVFGLILCIIAALTYYNWKIGEAINEAWQLAAKRLEITCTVLQGTGFTRGFYKGFYKGR